MSVCKIITQITRNRIWLRDLPVHDDMRQYRADRELLCQCADICGWAVSPAILLFCTPTYLCSSLLHLKMGCRNSPTLFYLCIFLGEFLLHCIPEWSGDTYRWISTTHDTKHQCECKFFQRSYAHHEQYKYHDKGCQGCINCSCKCLSDTLVDKLFQTFFTILCPHILTNTVEDNDCRVDRVTYRLSAYTQ